MPRVTPITTKDQVAPEHRPIFDALKDRYGVPWVVELTGLIGHYGLVTGMLNAFEMAPAPDAEQLPV